MMKRTFLFILLVALAASSCVREEILRRSTNYRIDFIIDDSVLYNKPKDVELVKMLCYDPQTELTAKEPTLYNRLLGNQLYFSPGDYTLVAYSFQNTATKITYPENFSILTAESEEIALSPYRIVTAPAHVYVGELVNYHIPSIAEEDGEYTITMHLKSPFDSWRVIVTGIQNLSYARTATFYISNQYQDMLLKDFQGEGNAVLAANGYVRDTTALYCDFATYGMIPGKNYELQISIIDAANATYRKTVDVTDQILDTLNTKHIIYVNFETKLSTMVQGGLQPSANEWDVEIDHRTLN